MLLLAIIGAGIGGTSSAHFLRKKFGPSCNITIYESGHIGGRLATTVMAGMEYEVGGSIIHSANKLMTEFLGETGNLKSFRRNINMTCSIIYIQMNHDQPLNQLSYYFLGLHKKDSSKIEDSLRFTIITKEGVAFQESHYSFFTAIKMIWRYGLWSLTKMNNYVSNMLDNFAR